MGKTREILKKQNHIERYTGSIFSVQLIKNKKIHFIEFLSDS